MSSGDFSGEGEIPFNKPFVVGREWHYISQAVARSQLSGGGCFSRQCSDWLESKLGCRRAILTHSCTAALEMAALLLDIEPGDEIIMPSFTFVSTANAFVLFGGVPVFVDIRPDTLNLDERQVEAAITSRTRAIVPVHYAGVACEMDDILAVAERHGLVVIEDAAHAMLSKYRDRYLGAIGSIGCLSFHETKNIISGEGGALLLNDPKYIERAEILCEKGTNRTRFFRGMVDKYTWVDKGSSYLPNELTAAFLFAQLENAHAINARRIALCRRYDEGLRALETDGSLTRPAWSGSDRANGHMFFILTRTQEERAALIRFLAGRGINAVFHYVPLHSAPAGRRFGRSSGTLPVTEDVSERVLRLPLFGEMTEAEVDKVCRAIAAFFGRV